MLHLTIHPKAIIGALHAGDIRTAKDLTYWLLSRGDDGIEQLQESDGGDSTSNNLGLAMIERALDWRIGSVVLDYIRATVKAFHRRPKDFYLTYDARGDQLLLHLSSGCILDEKFREVRCAA